MRPELLVPWFAWLAPRLLLLFGLGFLGANIKVGLELLRYYRSRKSALLIWPGRKPRYYGFSLALGVVLGLLVVVEFMLRRRYSLFGELMMFLYYGYLFPLSARIARGFYQDGIWSDSGFMHWRDISGVSWKDESSDVTLILISNQKNIARRLDIPSPLYGEVRRLLRDRVKAHDLQISGAGLDLGSRDEGDAI